MGDEEASRIPASMKSIGGIGVAARRFRDYRDEDKEKETTEKVSSELTSGLQNLMSQAVGAPMKKFIEETQHRFEEVLDLTASLAQRVMVLEEDNTRLQEQLDGASLTERIRNLEEQNAKLRDDMEKEVKQRHRETKEQHDLLRDVSLYIESIDTQNARVLRQSREVKIRAIIHRMRSEGLSTCWNSWKAWYMRKNKTSRLHRKALARFRNHNLCAVFFTWQSWARVRFKAAMKAQQGVGKAFTDLKEQMETEVAQRHYEVEQINIVLKQLALVVEASDSSRSRERQHHIRSNLTKILHCMANRMIAKAWSTWYTVWWSKKRKNYLYGKVVSAWTHKTLARGFRALAMAAKQLRSRKHQSTVDSLHSELIEVREKATRTTEGIEDLIRDSVVHMYYETSEAHRQAEINRALRKVVARFRLQLLCAAFEGWKQRYVHARRLKYLKVKAVERFFNFRLAICFQPWAAMARQTTKNRHEASVISNFEIADLCNKRIDDIHQSLARIFTTDPRTGVYTP